MTSPYKEIKPHSVSASIHQQQKEQKWLYYVAKYFLDFILNEKTCRSITDHFIENIEEKIIGNVTEFPELFWPHKW